MVDTTDPYKTIASIRSLPSLPTVLTDILHAVEDPDASALELSRYIASDQALSGAVLRLVNSAHYGFFRQISSVTTAVVILGFVEVRNLVLTASVYQTMDVQGNRYAQHLWRHSVGVAIASQRCARIMHSPPECNPFAAGLLHDCGKLALEELYPARYRQVVESAEKQGAPTREAERNAFQLDHAEAGATLAEHWNLPAAIVEGIRYHHEPDCSRYERKQCSVIAFADYLAYEAGLTGENQVWKPPFPDAAVMYLDLNERQIGQIREDVERTGATVGDIMRALQPEDEQEAPYA